MFGDFENGYDNLGEYDLTRDEFRISGVAKSDKLFDIPRCVTNVLGKRIIIEAKDGHTITVGDIIDTCRSKCRNQPLVLERAIRSRNKDDRIEIVCVLEEEEKKDKNEKTNTITTSEEAGAVMRDIMCGNHRIEEKVLDHGFVALVDCMPRLVPAGRTCDDAVVRAARVSYGKGTRPLSDDTGLIRYLMRNKHMTPFEMVNFTFHLRMPFFVARQWQRHRTASINEYSARYSVVENRQYHPDSTSINTQSTTNRQGRDGEQICSDETQHLFDEYMTGASKQYDTYCELISEKHNVSREIARIGIPLNTYTEFYWSCNLRNTLHLLQLRMDSHAQDEIRQYA